MTEEEQGARLSGVQAQQALDVSGMAWFCWDFLSDTAHGNRNLGRLFGLKNPEERRPVDEFFSVMHPDDSADVRAAVARAIETDSDYDEEFRVVHPDGGIVHIAGKGRVTARDETGKALELTGVNYDISDQQKHEEQLEHLIQEMSHRVKNAFAVIGALVRIGSRSATDIADYSDTLSAQIQAMGEAHTLAVRYAIDDQLQDAQIPLAQILRSALEPWKGAAPVQIEADDDIRVDHDRASSFAMLVYELATNGAKYGGLSDHGEGIRARLFRADDRISLCWTGKSHSVAQDAEVRERREKGESAGFGSVLIKHCMGQLAARSREELTDEGFHFECHFPA
ncbi:MAG: PAS domain-containing protein [Pacificimonas sp.]